MRLLKFVVLFCFLVGCSQQKKINKAISTLDNHPGAAADFCAVRFPVRDSVGEPVHDTIRAKNQDYTPALDSLGDMISGIESQALKDRITAAVSLIDCQAVVELKEHQISALAAQVQQLRSRYIICKPDTVKTMVPHYLENTAKVASLEYKNFDCQNSYKKAVDRGDAFQESRDKYRRWFFILLALVLVYIAGKIFSSRLPFKLP